MDQSSKAPTVRLAPDLADHVVKVLPPRIPVSKTVDGLLLERPFELVAFGKDTFVNVRGNHGKFRIVIRSLKTREEYSVGKTLAAKLGVHLDAGNRAEKEVAARLRGLGANPIKKGWPDFHADDTDDGPFVVEVKKDIADQLTPEQALCLLRLASAGIACFIAYPGVKGDLIFEPVHEDLFGGWKSYPKVYKRLGLG